MSKEIVISCKNFDVKAELLEGKCHGTCKIILDAIPMEGSANVWKEEVYFIIPTEINPENTTLRTEKGDVAYWPDGPGFCIFFGESQPAGPIQVFGKVKEGIEKFQRIKNGDIVKVRTPD